MQGVGVPLTAIPNTAKTSVGWPFLAFGGVLKSLDLQTGIGGNSRLAAAVRALSFHQLRFALPSSPSPVCERMNQVSGREQRDAENSSEQIDIMTDTVRKAETHPSEKAQSFADVGENYQQQTS